MDNDRFTETMETKIDELVDLYTDKYFEVNGGDAVLVDSQDIRSVATALGSGNPEVSRDMIRHLEMATNHVLGEGVEQDLNTVQGRAEDWIGKTADSFYDYLGEAQKSVANQVDLLQALTLIQRSQEAVITSSRKDAVAILDTAIDNLRKVDAETEFDAVSFALGVTGAILIVVGAVTSETGVGVGIALAGVTAMSAGYNSVSVEISGGDPTAIFDSATTAMQDLQDATESEFRRISSGMGAIVDKLDEYWDQFVPRAPDIDANSELELPA